MSRRAPSAGSRVRGAVSCLVLALAAAALAGSPAAAGEARAIDGDTLEIAGQRVDLVGIDAPEIEQECEWEDELVACGVLAREALAESIAGTMVSCERVASEAGRMLAVCRADGRDLSETMLRAGWAVLVGKAPPAHRLAESEARDAGRALWRGRFQVPSAWRAAQGGPRRP